MIKLNNNTLIATKTAGEAWHFFCTHAMNNQMSDHFYDQFVDDICDDVSSEIQVNSSVETNTLSISDQLCDNQLPPIYNCFMIE